jgi:hypothetical protein
MGIKVVTHGFEPHFRRGRFCRVNYPVDEETLESTGYSAGFVSFFKRGI